MKRRLKLKINGESPRGLFLAFVLAKFKCDVYIFDCLINSEHNYADQIYSFSNFSKNLLSNLNIWNEFEEISYGFNSVEFKDNIVSKQLLLRTESSEQYLNTFGWTVKYSDIRRLITNKLKNSDNVHFLKNQIVDESLIFDFEFNFKGFDEYSLENLNRINEHILIFNVCLRGNVEKRLYEINTTDGLLILTTINKSFYQIIWNNVPIYIKERSLNSKSFFLDNLTTLLPKEFKIDQIIGDIKSLNFNNISSVSLIKNKSIYFNENKFTSNTLYDFNFDFFFRFIYQINYFLENNNKVLIIYKYYYLLKNYMLLRITIYFYCCFINLLSINNKFLLILRKLLFTCFSRINFLKIFIIKILINSNNNDFIK